MNAVKESYWEPEGEEAKCDTGFLYINIALKKYKTNALINCALTHNSAGLLRKNIL